MRGAPKKEPRPVAIAEYIVTGVLLIISFKLAASDFTVFEKMVVTCCSVVVGLGICALNSFVYGRLCAKCVRLDGGH